MKQYIYILITTKFRCNGKIYVSLIRD